MVGKAERGPAVTPELRCLARALRCDGDDATRAFLRKEFASSLEFAQRFEAYVDSAVAYSGEGDAPSLAGVDRVQRVVRELRGEMPV